jgi:hypothetical protein
MSRDNLLWGEERIANELLVKLGIRVSPRTVRKSMRRKPGRGPRADQRWRTFLRNHAAAIVACDFCVAVTASFRVLYIFVIIEHASRRRLLHWNVTSNPTAAWTLQQLREAIASDHPYRFLVHDRDSIFTQALDTSIANLRLRVLKTPHRSPKANSLCERLIGSLRRECQCRSPKFTSSKANIAKRGSTKCRTRSKRRSLATDMADAIFTHPLLAEGLNTLFAAPGKNSLVIYSMMFPRWSEDPRAVPQGARQPSCRLSSSRARHAHRSSTGSKVLLFASPSGSTSS